MPEICCWISFCGRYGIPYCVALRSKFLDSTVGRNSQNLLSTVVFFPCSMIFCLTASNSSAGWPLYMQSTSKVAAETSSPDLKAQVAAEGSIMLFATNSIEKQVHTRDRLFALLLDKISCIWSSIIKFWFLTSSCHVRVSWRKDTFPDSGYIYDTAYVLYHRWYELRNN